MPSPGLKRLLVLFMSTYHREKAPVGAFSVIVQLHRLIVYSTSASARNTAANSSDERRQRPVLRPGAGRAARTLGRRQNCDLVTVSTQHFRGALNNY